MRNAQRASIMYAATCTLKPPCMTLSGKSFLQNTSATKKTAQKLLALLVILPTVLRHFIRALRRGIRFLVLALRMLEGQAHSYNECNRLGVEPRSRCLDKRLLPAIRFSTLLQFYVKHKTQRTTCAFEIKYKSQCTDTISIT